jgi:hypothetical protein
LDNFEIRHTDEDGDAINIDNDKELKDAIDHALNSGKNNARVVIRLSLKKMDTQVSNRQDPSENSNENHIATGNCLKYFNVFTNHRQLDNLILYEKASVLRHNLIILNHHHPNLAQTMNTLILKNMLSKEY